MGTDGCCVCVAHNEINTFDSLAVHVVDSVRSAATNADYFDQRIALFGQVKIERLKFHSLKICRGLTGFETTNGIVKIGEVKSRSVNGGMLVNAHFMHI